MFQNWGTAHAKESIKAAANNGPFSILYMLNCLIVVILDEYLGVGQREVGSKELLCAITCFYKVDKQKSEALVQRGSGRAVLRNCTL